MCICVCMHLYAQIQVYVCMCVCDGRKEGVIIWSIDSYLLPYLRQSLAFSARPGSVLGVFFVSISNLVWVLGCWMHALLCLSSQDLWTFGLRTSWLCFEHFTLSTTSPAQFSVCKITICRVTKMCKTRDYFIFLHYLPLIPALKMMSSRPVRAKPTTL